MIKWAEMTHITSALTRTDLVPNLPCLLSPLSCRGSSEGFRKLPKSRGLPDRGFLGPEWLCGVKPIPSHLELWDERLVFMGAKPLGFVGCSTPQLFLIQTNTITKGIWNMRVNSPPNFSCPVIREVIQAALQAWEADVKHHMHPRRVNVSFLCFPPPQTPWKWLLYRILALNGKDFLLFCVLIFAAGCNFREGEKPHLSHLVTPAPHGLDTELSLHICWQMTTESRGEGSCEEWAVTVSPATEINESMGPSTSGVPGDPTRHFRGTTEAEARWQFVPTPVKIPYNRNGLWWQYPKSP